MDTLALIGFDWLSLAFPAHPAWLLLAFRARPPWLFLAFPRRDLGFPWLSPAEDSGSA
jgi:hypothetical protein